MLRVINKEEGSTISNKGEKYSASIYKARQHYKRILSWY